MRKILFAILFAPLLFISCSKTEIEKLNIEDDFIPVQYNFEISGDEGPVTIDNSLQGSRIVFATPTPFSWTEAGLSVLRGVLSGIGSFTASTLLSEVVDLFTEPSEEVILLNEIKNQLNSMEKTLDALNELATKIYDKVDEAEMNAIMFKFHEIDDEFSVTKFLNAEYSEKVAKAQSLEDVKALLKEWSLKSGPQHSLTLVKKICEFGPTYNGLPINYLSAFDHIVFNQYAWEKEGYDIREAFRASVAIELLRAIELSVMYFYATDTPELVHTAVNYANRAIEFVSNSKVDYHNDVAICQIKNHHFTVNNNAFSSATPRTRFKVKVNGYGCQLSSYSWMMAGEEEALYGDVEASRLADEGYSLIYEGSYGYCYRLVQLNDENLIKEYKASHISQSDLQALIDYYLPVVDGDFTVLDIFRAGGMIIPDSMESHMSYRNEGDSEQVFIGTADTGISPCNIGGKNAVAIYGIINAHIPLAVMNTSNRFFETYVYDELINNYYGTLGFSYASNPFHYTVYYKGATQDVTFYDTFALNGELVFPGKGLFMFEKGMLQK